MVTLEGWCQDIDNLADVADHTYVYCPEQNVYWGCWGGHSAPDARRVCQGQGNFARANCISRPHSQAGILYGVNGVCHQTANRILFPAGVIISGAKFYWLSVLLYGTYGTVGLSHIEWDIRLRRCLGIETFALMPPDGRAQSEDDAERHYLDRVRALYREATIDQLRLVDQPEAQSNILSREMALMVEYRMGPDLEDDVVSHTNTLHSQLQAERADIEQGLHDGKLTGVQFAEKSHNMLGTTLRSLAEKLGPEKYERLLGITPDQTPVIVRPDIIQTAFGG